MKHFLDGEISLSEQVREVQRIVAEENSPPVLFRLPDGSLGTVENDEDGDGWGFNALNVEGLNAMISEWITYRVAPRGKNDTGERPSLPRDVVSAYVGLKKYPGVPKVRRLGRAPIIGKDLSVAWEVGYAPEAQTYITESMDRTTIGTIDANGHGEVSSAQARAAGKYLMNWFKSFAFVTPEAAADCLALALTPMLMGYIKGPIPGGVFIANKEGSGKTTCAQMVSILSTGLETPPTTWPNQGQMRNMITTTLKSSSTISLFDNVKTDLDNDALESLLTSRQWKERKFHSQDEMTLPNDTVWLFTKNSPSLSPDMLRRLILVSLDKFRSKTTWDETIIRRALESREEIQKAMVTLVMYWRGKGTPRGTMSFIGFEEWSEAVSGILEAAGISGFGVARVTDVSSVYTEDDDAADMVNRIYAVMGGETWSGKELWDIVNQNWSESVDDPEWKDKNAIYKWLSSGAANPVMSVGKKVSALNGKEMKGSNLVIRRLDGQRAKYRVEVRSSGIATGYRSIVEMAD